MFAHKILQRISGKVQNTGIRINNLSCLVIDDQDAVLCSFKQAGDDWYQMTAIKPEPLSCR